MLLQVAADPKITASARSLTEGLLELPFLRGLPPFLKPILLGAVEMLLLVLLFLLLRGVITRVVNRAAEAVAARDAEAGNHSRVTRVRTLASLVRSTLNYILGFIFLVMALGILGLNVAGVLGTAGVAGLAVGFGAQKLVKDVITGFFLLTEDQYAVGDYVTINGVTGTVEELGMRITRIRDDDGRLFVLSNGDIAQVCNQSRGPVAGTLEIGVAAAADTRKATDVLNAAFDQAAREHELPLAEPARVEGIAAVDATKTVLRVRFRADPKERPNEVALRLRETARAALQAAEIPLA